MYPLRTTIITLFIITLTSTLTFAQSTDSTQQSSQPGTPPITPYRTPSTADIRIPNTVISLPLVRCPQGEITIPSTNADEQPTIHAVDELWVLSHEVTWDIYDIFIYKLDEPEPDSPSDAITRPSKPYVPPDRGMGHETYPAMGMTRAAAEAFCEWLSVKLDLPVRLPTAAEWSYLASADNGSITLDDHAWHLNNSEDNTQPVSTKAPNAFGLHDTLGNVAEWVITDTRKPIAMGGSYKDQPDDLTPFSQQRQRSTWNQSDPQIPKSAWWLADCSWVGFRFVIDSNPTTNTRLKELTNDHQPLDESR